MQHRHVEPHAANIDSTLAEVRGKLATVYRTQTKTSLLPWLKGHQAIPMNEFYTNSRILAVDKQGKQTSQAVDLVKDLISEEEVSKGGGGIKASVRGFASVVDQCFGWIRATFALILDWVRWIFGWIGLRFLDVDF